MATAQPHAASENASTRPAEPESTQHGTTPVIRTPDQRVRVFVSSTLQELAQERAAAREAISQLRLAPILFELGARAHPPKELYRAYLAQSDVFVGIYWERYGWVAPGMDVSGLEDEYRLAGDKPKLIYVKAPAPEREPGLKTLLSRIRDEDGVSYKPFSSVDELRGLVVDDLALLLTERFAVTERVAVTQGNGPVSPEASERRRDNLPVQRSRLINRTAEVASARDLLRRKDVGLLTLTGPGGTGKTRLALHVAHNLREVFADGVVFAPLASLTDPNLVASKIAESLGIRDAEGRPVVDSLVAFLRPKHLLLVLDNFEQVIAAAPLLTQLLEQCPQLTILVTSRSPLRLRGERELPVPPLTLPDPSNLPAVVQLSKYAAVELFIARAREVKPDFIVTNETAPAIAEICYRLDGLPLAIELAAARTKLLSPPALLARLDRRLPLLTSGARDMPARQQTLRNAIAWSFDLLDEPEKRLFRSLAVFVGGFTLEAAAEVCGAAQDSEFDVLDGIASLVDKNLLRPREGAAGQPRFAMLETIREYANERLAESGETETQQQAHAHYFCAFVEEAELSWTGAARETWLERREVEHDNLRATLAWSKANAIAIEARMTGALAWFWYLRGHVVEGRAWLDDALARTDPSARTVTRAKVLTGAGLLAWAQGDYVTAKPQLEEAIAIYRERGEKRWTAAAQMNLAILTFMQGNLAAARSTYEEALALAREVGDNASAAFALRGLGDTYAQAGDLDTAHRMFTESLSMFRTVGDAWGISVALGSLAMVALAQGDAATARALNEESLPLLRQTGNTWSFALVQVNLGLATLLLGDLPLARKHFLESLAAWQEMGNQTGAVMSLAGLAGLAAAVGQAERAGRLLGAVGALFPADGVLLNGTDRAAFDRQVAATRALLDEGAFARGWDAGQGMTLEQAIAFGQADTPA
ncbi:MAG: hypothetical protein JWO42_3834 [Chloroflexi bacterium]|nr:hypothetical protein [Chloroflexota bacterium]